MPRLRRTATTLIVGSVIAGCGSSSAGTAHSDSGSILPPVSPCPTPAGHGDAFPAGKPALVPHPAFATSPRYLHVSVKGQQLLTFTTAMPLRDAAAFVETEYPANGYRIVGGDSEQHEADIVFVHGSVHGKTRLSGVANCSTTWTVLTLPSGTPVDDDR